MRKELIILFAVVALVTSCKKDFLEKLPIDKLTPETVFIDNENFKTYSWGLYDHFGGHGAGIPSAMQSEFITDNMNETRTGGMSEYAFQTKVVPGEGGGTSTQVVAKFNFAYVRRVNVMLDHIETSELSQTDKDHWRGVGYFFRALRYTDLIASFGDVPWIEHALSDTSKVLFAKSTPRDEVARNILENLLYAEAHIKVTGDGKNTITPNVVRALISRFCLFEGTWRKYHGLPDAGTYLAACTKASEALIASYPAIIPIYDDVFNSEDLQDKPGIILFKPYVANLTAHSNPRVAGSTSWFWDLTKDAVESYLCTDGKPVSTSPVFAGDRTMYNEFRNRDRRLYFTVVPPYKVTVVRQPTTWSNTANTADAEYINLMKTVGGTNKSLPLVAWSKTWTTGNIIGQAPHFRGSNGGQAQSVSELGYFFWKFYNKISLDNANNSTNDAPLFRIEEVMLNYAEAMFELGGFNQSIADLTINKLRTRAGVAKMIVGEISGAFDTKRDMVVDPVLWEIRRERRVELMGEGFRFNDIKRWKKGTYLNKQALGVYVRNADYGNKLKINGGTAQGYVEYFGKPLGWLDKYYLEPLPTQDLALNPQLIQSPGY